LPAVEKRRALGARTELRHGQSLLLPQLADPLPHLSEEPRLARDVRIHPCRHTNSTISLSASSPYDAPNMARECSRPPKRTSFFGAPAAVKHASTFGVARSESRSAQTNSLRPVIFFESSSGTAATGAEIATTHSTSPSKLDARTALPPIDDPTSPISLTPRARRLRREGRRPESTACRRDSDSSFRWIRHSHEDSRRARERHARRRAAQRPASRMRPSSVHARGPRRAPRAAFRRGQPRSSRLHSKS